MQVIVIGAGITGLATAWTLAEAGCAVTLVERAAGPAQGASARNGAQLSYAYVAPLASWSTLRNVPALLLDRQSPLRLRPGLSWPLWNWCLRFLAACRDAEAERSTRALLELGALSRERFEHWRQRHAGADTLAFAGNGKLVLLRDRGSWAAAGRQIALQAPWGPPQQLLDAAACLRLEPALRHDPGPLLGGVHTPSESVADCAQVCHQLAGQLAPRAALQWRTHALGWRRDAAGRVAALRVRRDDGDVDELRADAYVVANGVDAPPLLAPLGLRLPIAALKGYSVELPAPHLRAMPTLSVTDSARKIVFAPLGEGPTRRLRVAGMAELVRGDPAIDPRRIAQLRAATAALFGLRDEPADLQPWAGQRPTTPTGRPYIGRLRQADNVLVNVGQGALGFTLAFGSAALLLAQLRGEATPLRDTTAYTAALA